MIRGRQLSRDTEHRKALRRNLVQSLFENGKIRTTLPKAKEVKSFAEKLITLARTNTLNARRRVIAQLQDRRLVDVDQEFTGQTVVQKLFSEIAPKFKDRTGGYTRIIKTSDYRIGDGGSWALLQLLTEESKPQGQARRSAGLRRKRNQRRHEFAASAIKNRARKDEPAPETPAAPEASS
ncbi:MAG TPA: 50S ribosomal protein L17 [Tepidisphaeraceae bacterium]|nr:50S ribosomal protein L17 [Tepidisphaeraceae bacterium]